MIGIYKIENLVNKKVYIGQSKNIEKRWLNHKSDAFNSISHSYDYPLYKAIRKYGLENFDFVVLEECLVEELNEKERQYIQQYDSFFNGYNLTLGGDSSGNKINKEKVIGIIKDLETTELYHSEIAKKWNISTEMVQGINTGRYWKQDREYPIQTIHQPKIKKVFNCIDCGKEITKSATRCLFCENKRRTSNLVISREELKNLIRTTPFTQIGKQYGVSDNAIRKWCDKFNLPRRASEIKKYSDKEWEKI